MTERKVHFSSFDGKLRKHDLCIIVWPSQTFDQAPHNAVADRNLTLVVSSNQCGADISDLYNGPAGAFEQDVAFSSTELRKRGFSKPGAPAPASAGYTPRSG